MFFIHSSFSFSSFSIFSFFSSSSSPSHSPLFLPSSSLLILFYLIPAPSFFSPPPFLYDCIIHVLHLLLLLSFFSFSFSFFLPSSSLFLLFYHLVFPSSLFFPFAVTCGQ